VDSVTLLGNAALGLGVGFCLRSRSAFVVVSLELCVKQCSKLRSPTSECSSWNDSVGARVVVQKKTMLVLKITNELSPCVSGNCPRVLKMEPLAVPWRESVSFNSSGLVAPRIVRSPSTRNLSGPVCTIKIRLNVFTD
jgi:hypothetical protein